MARPIWSGTITFGLVSVPVPELSKSELNKVARDLGIRSRSTMTRNKLEKAIADAGEQKSKKAAS